MNEVFCESLCWQKSTKQPAGARICFWQKIAWPASFLHTGVTTLILLISVNLFEIFQWRLLFKFKKKFCIKEKLQCQNIYNESRGNHHSSMFQELFDKILNYFSGKWSGLNVFILCLLWAHVCIYCPLIIDEHNSPRSSILLWIVDNSTFQSYITSTAWRKMECGKKPRKRQVELDWELAGRLIILQANIH